MLVQIHHRAKQKTPKQRRRAQSCYQQAQQVEITAASLSTGLAACWQLYHESTGPAAGRKISGTASVTSSAGAQNPIGERVLQVTGGRWRSHKVSFPPLSTFETCDLSASLPCIGCASRPSTRHGDNRCLPILASDRTIS